MGGIQITKNRGKMSADGGFGSYTRKEVRQSMLLVNKFGSFQGRKSGGKIT